VTFFIIINQLVLSDSPAVMGKSQVKSQVQIANHWQKWFKWKPQIKNQITNQFHHNDNFFENVQFT